MCAGCGGVGGGKMRYLSLYSKRLIEKDNWVGIDDRYWLKVVEHKRLFRKSWWSIELIFPSRENRFLDRDAALARAMNCIADMHDLIERDIESG
jgi:hypothetical protein